MAIPFTRMPNRLLSISDLDAAGVSELLEHATALKAGRSPATGGASLAGRSVALIFEKPSLRTRVSFEVGIARLGGTPIVLQGEEVGLGSRESARDVARTLERYVDLIVARVFDHALLEELAGYAVVPVVNALSDVEHPCQALADLLALKEHWGVLAGRQLVYVGDGNNVAASLLLAGASVGMHVRVVSPAGYAPDDGIVTRARAIAKSSGARIEVGEDPVAGVRGADAVYTDVWASMGQEAEAERRREIFRPYAITSQLLAEVPTALVMHCLPAHRGDEISSDVLDGPTSIVFDQAEDRLWVQMAVLLRMLRPRRPAAVVSDPGQEPVSIASRTTGRPAPG